MSTYMIPTEFGRIWNARAQALCNVTGARLGIDGQYRRMRHPAARLRALAGALVYTLVVNLALATVARADDNPVRALYDGPSVERVAPKPARRASRAHRARVVVRGGALLAGVSAPLAAKARQIAAACGSRVVSGVRHTRVAGSRRMSLHASGRAVDMVGNPSCIYAHLRGWPGGVSTDYAAVGHVHFSVGGREDGRRFAHHVSTRRAYARAHHRLRVASR